MKQELDRQGVTKPQVFGAGVGTGVLATIFAGGIVGAITGAISFLIVPVLILLALFGAWKILK